MLGKEKPGAGPGLEGIVLKVKETIEVVQGFGVTYRIKRRTWLLFGVLPLLWVQNTERG